MSAQAHTAVVLAAGGSQRLGRPKQLLARDGEPLVHRAVRLAVDSGAGEVLLVVGAARASVEDAVAGLDCVVVVNPDWAQGLAGSLQAVATRVAARGAPVLVLGCDQPALDADHLRALLDGASAAPSGCAATRLGEVVGVPAVVPADWFADSAGLHGDRGFGARLRALPPASLFVLDAPDLVHDVDTRADLENAVRRGWLDSG